ncbi:MAG TPA: hypothetical protein VF786_00230 [Terriglobales bacterium]
MESYFNYFTEIEEHFQRRRGTLLLLSTLDWALIESWKDAGIPLEAVLRGIDSAFDRYERRPSKTRKINGLAWCSQEVLAASEEIAEAAVGSAREPRDSSVEHQRIAEFLTRNAEMFERAAEKVPEAVKSLVEEDARNLRELAKSYAAATADNATTAPSMEELEMRMTVVEEKLFAALHTATGDDRLLAIRAQAERELAPYRGKMSGPQIDQLLKQYQNKKLMELYGLPRLSLYYML